MHIDFVNKENGPQNLICEAEIVFDSEDNLLAGLRLVGFTLWRNEGGEVVVTMPSRSWGDASGKRFFDLLRAGDGGGEALRRLKSTIREQYRLREGSAAA